AGGAVKIRLLAHGGLISSVAHDPNRTFLRPHLKRSTRDTSSLSVRALASIAAEGVVKRGISDPARQQPGCALHQLRSSMMTRSADRFSATDHATTTS